MKKNENFPAQRVKKLSRKSLQIRSLWLTLTLTLQQVVMKLNLVLIMICLYLSQFCFCQLKISSFASSLKENLTNLLFGVLFRNFCKALTSRALLTVKTFANLLTRELFSFNFQQTFRFF
jgi:hypothetical protein